MQSCTTFSLYLVLTCTATLLCNSHSLWDIRVFKALEDHRYSLSLQTFYLVINTSRSKCSTLLHSLLTSQKYSCTVQLYPMPYLSHCSEAQPWYNVFLLIFFFLCLSMNVSSCPCPCPSHTPAISCCTIFPALYLIIYP